MSSQQYNWIQCNSKNKKPGNWDGYLADTEVSWSEGWRILQVVKVYVELVWDIHFPGKLTRGEEKEKKTEDVRDGVSPNTLHKNVEEK